MHLVVAMPNIHTLISDHLSHSLSQVQDVLSTMGEEELDKLKSELVAIKEIFIKREEQEEASAAEENGDHSSQINSTTHFCESPRTAQPGTL